MAAPPPGAELRPATDGGKACGHQHGVAVIRARDNAAPMAAPPGGTLRPAAHEDRVLACSRLQDRRTVEMRPNQLLAAVLVPTQEIKEPPAASGSRQTRTLARCDCTQRTNKRYPGQQHRTWLLLCAPPRGTRLCSQCARRAAGAPLELFTGRRCAGSRRSRRGGRLRRLLLLLLGALPRLLLFQQPLGHRYLTAGKGF